MISTCKAVHQLLPNFSPRDAIGNEAVMMQKILRERGLRSEIYAEHGEAASVDELLASDLGQAALLYHFSVASTIPGRIAPLPALKLVRYHNITPPWFFNNQSELTAQQACSLGRRQIPMVGVIADAVLADSAYNAAEISPYTVRPPTVMPLLRDYDHLVQLTKDIGLNKAQLHVPKPSLLFVGRLAPNKCQQDLLILLHLAHRHITRDLQLILVGGFFSTDFHRLFCDLAAHLGLRISTDVNAADADVIIPKDVSDADMAALYRQARVFVSMSEHEGFGVPLVEAMFFDLPILAHRATAVPETVGDAGLLVDKNDWPATVAALRAVLQDDGLRTYLISAMQQRRKDLSLSHSKQLFSTWLDAL